MKSIRILKSLGLVATLAISNLSHATGDSFLYLIPEGVSPNGKTALAAIWSTPSSASPMPPKIRRS